MILISQKPKLRSVFSISANLLCVALKWGQLLGISGDAAVHVMQTAQYGFTDDLAFGFRLASDRRVLIQRHMRPTGIVIFDELRQYRVQMPFVQDDHVIEAFPSQRAHHSFGNGILPGRVRGGWRVFQAETFNGSVEIVTEYFVIVSNDVFRGIIKSKGFAKLLNGHWECGRELTPKCRIVRRS